MVTAMMRRSRRGRRTGGELRLCGFGGSVRCVEWARVTCARRRVTHGVRMQLRHRAGRDLRGSGAWQPSWRGFERPRHVDQGMTNLSYRTRFTLSRGASKGRRLRWRCGTHACALGCTTRRQPAHGAPRQHASRQCVNHTCHNARRMSPEAMRLHMNTSTRGSLCSCAPTTSTQAPPPPPHTHTLC
jgi:hypothetical protein